LCTLAEGLVRTVLVAVLDSLAEDGFEVASSKDEHAVEVLAPDGANDESLWVPRTRPPSSNQLR
jgi:hypothetical protein